ncbi:ribosomal protein S18-alanine N-acetyltransferase [Cumulibacter manganitolerans]|uniref:ribosomal protein S18-alanine N-acetyltransferase n=1 Tax=Cumulibacter manganitolerans TaxID=1884992 RepID=UPI0012958634|nr:ribosomal protein S18-alanine N-acetyltransferase [Cumulibacter manganitolerans]
MTGIELRPMTTADLPAVVALEHELFGAQAWNEQTLADELAERETRWYVVAAEGAEIIGYAGLATFGDEAHVMTIGTGGDHQRRGVGRRLLRALLQEADHSGVARVILEVRVDNGAAIALYESEGFSTVGVRKRYYQPEDVDAAVMIRG